MDRKNPLENVNIIVPFRVGLFQKNDLESDGLNVWGYITISIMCLIWIFPFLVMFFNI